MRAFVGLISASFLLPVLSLSAQSVVGRVTEKTSGSAVRNPGIVLMDASGRTRAAVLGDSLGSYRITAPTPGVYRVSIQGSGLTTLNSDALNLRADQATIFDAALSLEAKALPTVVVKDKPIVHAPPGNPHKYDQFLARKALGFGHFITRDEIDSKPQNDTRALFSNIAGIKFRIDGAQWFLRSQRCSGRTIPGSGADETYNPLIFIDGIQVPRAKGAEMETLRTLPPQEIEAIEVYQGGSEMPAEAKGDACFAIFIWRR